MHTHPSNFTSVLRGILFLVIIIAIQSCGGHIVPKNGVILRQSELPFGDEPVRRPPNLIVLEDNDILAIGHNDGYQIIRYNTSLDTIWTATFMEDEQRPISIWSANVHSDTLDLTIYERSGEPEWYEEYEEGGLDIKSVSILQVDLNSGRELQTIELMSSGADSVSTHGFIGNSDLQWRFQYFVRWINGKRTLVGKFLDSKYQQKGREVSHIAPSEFEESSIHVDSFDRVSLYFRQDGSIKFVRIEPDGTVRAMDVPIPRTHLGSTVTESRVVYDSIGRAHAAILYDDDGETTAMWLYGVDLDTQEVLYETREVMDEEFFRKHLPFRESYSAGYTGRFRSVEYNGTSDQIFVFLRNNSSHWHGGGGGYDNIMREGLVLVFDLQGQPKWQRGIENDYGFRRSFKSDDSYAYNYTDRNTLQVLSLANDQLILKEWDVMTGEEYSGELQ